MVWFFFSLRFYDPIYEKHLTLGAPIEAQCLEPERSCGGFCVYQSFNRSFEFISDFVDIVSRSTTTFAMTNQRLVSRRTRQQIRDTFVAIFNLFKTIVVTGVLTILWPIIAPITLAIQLWNSLPSYRQVRRATPTSVGDVRRSVPSLRQVWNSIPSLRQILNALMNLVRVQATEYAAQINPAEIAGNATRRPVR